MYATLREELLRSVPAVGTRLGELRFDTDLDVSHGVTRYLEMVKVAALLERPRAVRGRGARGRQHAAAAGGVELPARGPGDVEPRRGPARRRARPRARAAALAAREEPSLEPFLPKRGAGLMLSASDIETYRTCPLKYKFAAVFRIPSEPTMNQRFGILVHQVLERFHQDGRPGAGGGGPRLPAELLGCSTRAGGAAASATRRRSASSARRRRPRSGRYHERFASDRAEPVWLEKAFQFKLGPHVLRGRVDRVDRLPDGTYELIDYKTGRPRTAAQLREDVQLSLYAVAAREAWQLESSREAYLYVLDDEKVRVPAEEIDEGWITDTVMEVADGILGQGFEPTPSYSACSMCDFRIACPAAER
jgi:DNA helicase-2/ATP-dependent DNA helicase PcrA